MPTAGDDSIVRIRRDHERMLELIDRIRAECNQRDKINHCNDCTSDRRGACQGNIEQLIRSFVESTLKHNLIESMFMEDRVPDEHRIAHNQAHLEIAQQLKAIRAIFSECGNKILAIEGIERVHQTLIAHFRDYDKPLESYLNDATLAPSHS